MASARAWLAANRRPLIVAGRIAVSGAIAYALAQALDLALPIWAVISAAIVGRAAATDAVKSGRDRLLGTGIGALFGMAVALIRPYGIDEWLLILAALAVPGYVAARRPGMGTAPVATAIVLAGDATGASSVMTAIHRVTEVALGAAVAVVVTLIARWALRRIWPPAPSPPPSA